jgi:hypothetical protein
LCTKEHLKREGFAKSPALFNGTPRDFQTDKLRNLSFFYQKRPKTKITPNYP